MENLLKLAQGLQAQVSAQMDAILKPENMDRLTPAQRELIQAARLGADLGGKTPEQRLVELQNILSKADGI